MQVLETTHQVGRLSVTAPDVSYKEMAHHCETLQMGKQQKMSHVMSVQLRQESLMNVPFQKYDDKARKVISYSYADFGFRWLCFLHEISTWTYSHDILVMHLFSLIIHVHVIL